MNKSAQMLLILMALSASVKSQNYFQKSYGTMSNEDSYGVQPTNDGGFLLCGHTDENASWNNVFIMKTNQSGDSIWTKIIMEGEAYAFAQTQDGGYIISGRTLVGGNGQALIIKLDLNGDTVWTKTYGGSDTDDFWDIIESSDGNYVAVGRTNSNANNDYQIYIVKTDTQGNEIWSYSYGDTLLDEYGYGISQTSDGGYVVTGPSVSLWQTVILRIGVNGSEEWFNIVGPASTGGKSVMQTQDGGFLILSDAENALPLIKTDSAGTELWSKWITTPNNSVTWGTSIIQLSNANYLITGATGSMSEKDLILIKADANGDTLWTRIFPKAYDELGRDIVEVNNNCYVITGFSLGDLINDRQIYLIKTDSTGDINPVVGNESIMAQNRDNLLNVHPNPLSSSSVITFTLEQSSGYSLKVYNVEGSLIKYLPIIKSGHRLSNDGMKPGIYLLELLDQFGVVAERTILVN